MQEGSFSPWYYSDPRAIITTVKITCYGKAKYNRNKNYL